MVKIPPSCTLCQTLLHAPPLSWELAEICLSGIPSNRMHQGSAIGSWSAEGNPLPGSIKGLTPLAAILQKHLVYPMPLG